MMAFRSDSLTAQSELHCRLRQERRTRRRDSESIASPPELDEQHEEVKLTPKHTNHQLKHRRLPIISGIAFLSLFLAALVQAEAAVSFSAERIEQAAEQYLRKALGPESEIESIGAVTDQHFDQERVVARISSGAERRSSVRNVLVEFVHEEEVLRQVMLPFRVKEYVMVPAAAHTLQQGRILQRSDIVLKRCEAQAAPRNSVELDQLIGRKLNSDVRAGQTLDENIAMSADGIIRGQKVVLVVKRGSIEVRTHGRALADAAPGQSVRVLRDGSRDPIVARARGAGVVEVLF